MPTPEPPPELTGTVHIPFPRLLQSQVRAWMDRWLPRSVRRRGPEARRRGRIVLVAALLGAVWGATLALLYLVRGDAPMSMVLSVSTAFLLISPALLRISGSESVTGAWVTWNLYVPMTALAVHTGGLHTLAAGTLVVIPLLGALLGGGLVGWGYAVLTLATGAGLWALDPPGAMADPLADGLTAGTVVLLLATVANMLRSTHDEALHRLHAAVAQLRSEVRKHHKTRSTLEDVHRELVEQARIAGRAELATNILHNVGNALSWVNMAAEEIQERLSDSRVGRLRRIVRSLDANKHRLEAYLTEDERGRLVLDYLSGLSLHLAAEREEMLETLDKLTGGLEHIRATVRMQQTYARSTPTEEVADVGRLIDEAIRYSDASNHAHNVQIETKVADLPPLFVDKHRVMQILVNLIDNAKHAVRDGATDGPRIVIDAWEGPTDRLRIGVTDNGIGIREPHLRQIFHHGFTTKRDGHGFGLHACLVAAREMQGTLVATSDGPGSGATFTLEIPLQRATLADYDESAAQATEVAARPDVEPVPDRGEPEADRPAAQG